MIANVLFFFFSDNSVLNRVSPAFLAPGPGFMEDSFSTGGGGEGMVQAIMRAMGSDGEWQMVRWLARCSPLAM